MCNESQGCLLSAHLSNTKGDMKKDLTCVKWLIFSYDLYLNKIFIFVFYSDLVAFSLCILEGISSRSKILIFELASVTLKSRKYLMNSGLVSYSVSRLYSLSLCKSSSHPSHFHAVVYLSIIHLFIGHHHLIIPCINLFFYQSMFL